MQDLPEKNADTQDLEGRLTRLTKELSVVDFIFRGIKEGLIFVDASGKVGRINPVMEEILGIKDEDTRGKYVRELLGDSELCPMIDGSVGHGDCIAVKGREFEVETSRLTGADGEHIGSVTLLHDITEKRRLDRQRADFVSMVTHDLKSPLTTILGYTALILEGGMGEMSADIKESIGAVKRSGEKLLTLIDDFLALSKLDSGVESYTSLPINLDRIAEDVVASFWPEASHGGKLLDLHIEPGLPAVMGDARQIERLLSNLIDNAIKFTKEKGRIRVSLELREEGQVAERAGEKPVTPGPHVEIAVKDNGIGIAADDLPHLFERYWRGRVSRGIKGSGLGLAIVKYTVEAHGGSLKVESSPGEGSVFYIWLPVKR